MEISFENLVSSPILNPIWSEKLQAIWHLSKGDWDSAHKIAQKDEQDPISCWLHALVHRQEGDAENSEYWYRRTNGVAVRKESLVEELRDCFESGTTRGTPWA